VHDLVGNHGREVDLQDLERGFQQLEVAQFGLTNISNVKGLLIFEGGEVELLVVLGQQFPEQVPVLEVGLEVGDLLAQLNLVIQPG
jgi:hypothetical protein